MAGPIGDDTDHYPLTLPRKLAAAKSEEKASFLRNQIGEAWEAYNEKPTSLKGDINASLEAQHSKTGEMILMAIPVSQDGWQVSLWSAFFARAVKKNPSGSALGASSGLEPTPPLGGGV